MPTIRAHSVLVAGGWLAILGCGVEPPEDTTPKPYTCSGTPLDCLRIGEGWVFEGQVESPWYADPQVIRLNDGRYRLYGAVAIDVASAWWGMASLISEDGLRFHPEAGYRLEGPTLFQHSIVRNPDGSLRMYWLDQSQGFVNELGNKAIRSAISTDDGVTFAIEDGDRLRYSGVDGELNGITTGKVVLREQGGYRMYYGGVSDKQRTLSAVSADGLSWTREDGIRLDILCPPETGIGVVPFVDVHGTIHTFTRTTRCTGDYEHAQAGLFDGTSLDGLTLAIEDTPFVAGYSKDGTLANQVEPEDLTVVGTPDGVRVYFVLYNAGKLIAETAIYSVIEPSLR